MVEMVIDLFEDRFLSRAWIGRYSGIIEPVKRKFRVESGFISETLPMACRVNRQDCAEEEKYYMTPHKDYRSVAYWEQLSEPTIEKWEWIPNGRGVLIKAKVRLVIWYDKRKLGRSGCPSLSEIDSDVLGITGMELRKVEDPSAYYVRLTMTDIRNQFSTIFAPYSYDVDKWEYLFHHPYGFKAYDYDLEVATNLECLPEFELMEEINCE